MERPTREDIQKVQEELKEAKVEPLPSTIKGFEFDLGALFGIKAMREGMKRQNRLMGKHCQARLQKAQSKRSKHKRKMKSFTP